MEIVNLKIASFKDGALKVGVDSKSVAFSINNVAITIDPMEAMDLIGFIYGELGLPTPVQTEKPQAVVERPHRTDVPPLEARAVTLTQDPHGSKFRSVEELRASGKTREDLAKMELSSSDPNVRIEPTDLGKMAKGAGGVVYFTK